MLCRRQLHNEIPHHPTLTKWDMIHPLSSVSMQYKLPILLSSYLSYKPSCSNLALLTFGLISILFTKAQRY